VAPVPPPQLRPSVRDAEAGAPTPDLLHQSASGSDRAKLEGWSQPPSHHRSVAGTVHRCHGLTSPMDVGCRRIVRYFLPTGVGEERFGGRRRPTWPAQLSRSALCLGSDPRGARRRAECLPHCVERCPDRPEQVGGRVGGPDPLRCRSSTSQEPCQLAHPDGDVGHRAEPREARFSA
jgi:hypothetical protein